MDGRFAGSPPSREQGVRNIREAAERGSDAAIEAKFGLIRISPRAAVPGALTIVTLRAAFPAIACSGEAAHQPAGAAPADAERGSRGGHGAARARPAGRHRGRGGLWRLKARHRAVALSRPQEAPSRPPAVLAGDGRNWIKDAPGRLGAPRPRDRRSRERPAAPGTRADPVRQRQ